MVEFRTLRDAVRQELDDIGITRFVFEAEGASDQSPEEMFQRAVRGASLYIGVFGKGCGKYTRKEYEIARAQKIACHLYVQNLPDEERSDDLNDFLKSVSGVTNVPTRHPFSSTDQLIRQIRRDLWRWKGNRLKPNKRNRAQINTQGNLPLLCDRDPQEIHFGEQVISYFKVRSTRPLLLILPGPEQEKHGLYLQRVKIWSLKQYLKTAGICVKEGEANVYRFRTSLCAMSKPEHVRMEIVELLGTEMESDASIVAYLKDAGIKALVIEVRVYASECSWNPHKPLQLIADYLAAFPDTSGRILVGIVVTLAEDQEQGWFQRWWVGDWAQTGIQELQERYRDGTKVLIEGLPRLTPPTVAHVRRWLEHEDVRCVVHKQELEGIFQGRNSLPMEDLHSKLLKLLGLEPTP